VSRASFWDRLVHGTRWTWLAEPYRTALPADLESTVMDLESRDRLHAKQGRSTARVHFHTGGGPLAVYLKRHYRLPRRSGLAALVHPGGLYSPAKAEWANLERARALGIDVPEVVAAGERIGPWGELQSFLMVAELTGCLPLHEAIPLLAERLDRDSFGRLKRGLIREMAEITARLHRARVFHKDLYLCHFYLDMREPGRSRLALIDLHRLAEHRLTAAWWRWKDLGQLLFSSFDVAGIDDRDRSRFWAGYRRRLGLKWPRRQARIVALRAERYRVHNRQA